MPRYFTESICGRWIFSWTGGHVSFFKMKVTLTDLVSFAFIRHFLSHNWISRKCNCNLCEAIAGFSCAVRTTVSLANVAVVLSSVVARSAVYRR